MRTTMRLPDELYEEVRRQALNEGTTVTSFVEAALRTALARHDQQRGERFVVVPFVGDGTLPGVDLDDSAALADLMEG